MGTVDPAAALALLATQKTEIANVTKHVTGGVLASAKNAEATREKIVAALTAPTPKPTPTGPSGIAMPTTAPASYTAGVKWSAPIFSDDFTAAIEEGAFLTSYAYAEKWFAYPNTFHDTSGAGTYEPDILSVSDSCLQMALGTVDGVVQVAAPIPIIHGDGNAYHGQTYGRYDVCFKADAGLTGFKTAWLLWSDANDWNQGEIDFPEGGLGGGICGYSHDVQGSPSQNVLAINTDGVYTDWHVATTEWSPGAVTFALDGKVVGDTVNKAGVPADPMHYILQTETDGGAPNPTAAGRVYVDWVVIYAPA